MQALANLSTAARAVRAAELHDAGVAVLTGEARAAMIAACDAIPHESDIDAAIVELRAAGFSDPCLPPRPTSTDAIAYVRDHFAADYAVPIHVVGAIPSRDGEHVRDVLFVMGNNPRPMRMSVWFEPVAPAGMRLYGEW